jgi:hypothetical protein
MRRIAFACAASLVVALSGFACGDSGTTEVVETRPAQQRTVTTGTVEVDQIIDEALNLNEIELAGLVGYQNLPCTFEPTTPDGAPACRPEETEGQIVEVMAASTCEDAWIRPEVVPDTLSAALGSDDVRFLTAYRPAADYPWFQDGLGADVVVVFATGDGEGSEAAGAAFHLTRGRIVWVRASCDNVLELMAPEGIGSYIIEPPAIATPAAE